MIFNKTSTGHRTVPCPPLKKVVLLIMLLIVLVVLIINSRYESIEEKIIDDTNTGISINADMTVDLFVIDEYSEDFYVCVGDTTSERICVLSIQYTQSGLSYANKQIISKDALFDEHKRKLKINNQEIIYGFTNEIEEQSIKIDGRTLELFVFNYLNGTEEKNTGFWYYVE